MEPRLETFLCVCQTMNFTRAAEQLNLTQPAVSQHIRFLEKQYGMPLFIHDGRRLCLTPAGKVLRSAVSVMRNDEAEVRRRMQTAEAPSQQLFFGVTMTIGEYAVTQPLAAYCKRHPEKNIKVVFGNTKELLELLEQGQLDFALVEGYYPANQFDHMPYSTEAFVPVCAASHQFAREPRRLRDLLCERLIVREPGSGTRNILERNLALQDLTITDFAHYIQVGNMHTIIGLMCQDCGITFLYRIAVEKELAQGSCHQLHLQDFSMEHDFDFIWVRNSIFSAEHRAICSELKALASS